MKTELSSRTWYAIHTAKWKKHKLLAALRTGLAEESRAVVAWTPGRNTDARVPSVARSRVSGECLFRSIAHQGYQHTG
jgi:hypothetical protein